MAVAATLAPSRDPAPFHEACAAVAWAPFDEAPAFEAANRIDACGARQPMDREMLARQAGDAQRYFLVSSP